MEAKVNPSGVGWGRFDRRYFLPEGEVHVWRINSNMPTADIVRLKRVLSPSEQERADKFRFEVDRRRSVIGRGYLRLLLGQILCIPPKSLEFKCDEFGKPHLTASGPTPEFNLSHSGNLILIAIAWGRAVGVDIEKLRTDLEPGEIASRFFSANECKALASLVGSARYEAFFACWTRKEAYLKARGVGLSSPLDQFDVSLLPNEEPRLLMTRHDPTEAGRWRLVALETGPEYAAALAASGSSWALKCWDWDLELLINLQ